MATHPRPAQPHRRAGRRRHAHPDRNAYAHAHKRATPIRRRLHPAHPTRRHRRRLDARLPHRQPAQRPRLLRQILHIHPRRPLAGRNHPNRRRTHLPLPARRRRNPRRHRPRNRRASHAHNRPNRNPALRQLHHRGDNLPPQHHRRLHPPPNNRPLATGDSAP